MKKEILQVCMEFREDKTKNNSETYLRQNQKFEFANIFLYG